MTNPFPHSLDNKRYHTWNYYLRQRFGCKVMKIPLNAGFTCPNIDGSKGVGGCIYCSPAGSGDFAGDSGLDTATQFREVRTRLGGKWPDAKYIAYFQARTGTYGPVEEIRARIEPALEIPGVVGVSVATRADCLPKAVVDYLRELASRTWLMVELGLQTIHNRTAERINRCHSYREFLEGYEKLRTAQIPVCVHLINGLPGEDRAMMLETVQQVGALAPHSVKIHMLHVLRGTVAAKMLAAGEFCLPDREEYVSIVCDQLEWLPPDTVLQRLTGDGIAADLIAPLWTSRKTVVLNEIDKELLRRDSWQGKALARK